MIVVTKTMLSAEFPIRATHGWMRRLIAGSQRATADLTSIGRSNCRTKVQARAAMVAQRAGRGDAMLRRRSRTRF
jgi:hypothetical protein